MKKVFQQTGGTWVPQKSFLHQIVHGIRLVLFPFSLGLENLGRSLLP